MKVFGSSGVRGVANEVVTPEYVLRIAAAAGSVWIGCGPGGANVAVGP